MTRSIPSGIAALALTVVAVASVEGQQTAPPPELTPQGRGLSVSYQVAFGGDGRWLAQADRGRIRIVDSATGRVARELASSGAVSDVFGLTAFAADPHGDLLVTCDASGALVGFNVATGRQLWKTEGVPPVKSRYNASFPMFAEVRLSADGRTAMARIVTTSFGFRGLSGRAYQRQVDTRDGRVLTKVDEGKVPVDYSASLTGASPRFSDDGQWMHVPRKTKQGTRTRLLELRGGASAGREVEGEVMASHAGVNRVVMGAMPRINFTPFGSMGQSLTLLEATTGRLIGGVEGSSAQFSSDGSRILVLTFDAQAGSSWRLLDASDGRTVAESPSDTPLSWGWAISADGHRLATIQQGQLVMANAQPPIAYATVGTNPAPLLTAVDIPAVREGRVPDERTQQAAKAMQVEQLTPAAVFTSNGRWMVARADDGQLDAWDIATGNRMPFRLPAPRFKGGQLVIREADQPSGVAASLWRPLVVDSGGSMVERSQSGEYARVLPQNCALSYCVETQCPAFEGVKYEDLLKVGIDTAWGGCSVSPDKRRVVVSATEQPGRRLSKSLACKLALKCSARLVVFDIARRQAVPLVDADPAEPARFGFMAASVQWSPDGAFVVADTSISNDIRLRVWAADTGRLLDLDGLDVRAIRMVGFLPPTSRLVTVGTIGAGVTGEVDVWDLRDRRRILRLPRLSTAQASLLGGGQAAPLAMNDRVIVGPGDAGEVWIRSLKSGELLGQVRVLGNGDWLVTTPSGLFDGSPGGWRQLAWRVGEGVNTSPGELYFNEFYQPGLLADLLADRRVRDVRAVSERDRRQPTVAVAARASDSRTAVVHVAVTEAPPSAQYPSGSGVRDVRLFRNGVLVHVWRGAVALANGTANLEANVTVAAGRNQFVAYGFNADNIKSADAQAELVIDAAPRERTVYVLAIGINRYSNSEFNLSYAVADATTFGAEFAHAQEALGVTRVRVVNLLDGDATRQNIMLALARLGGANQEAVPAGTPAAIRTLEKAQPEDTVVVYFAGHGVARDDRFNLIPTDLAYTGTRANAYASIDQLLARGISDRDLERAFEPIDARHLLLVIDACNSGQALTADDARFGPMNSRGLAQLAYEKGMFVLTASQAYQAALESKELGHGYLTYALVNEGLKQPVADITPRDGNLTAREWFDYAVGRVPQLQMDAMTRAQQTGRLLTFGSGEGAASGELQTPRVFSRRDDDLPLVVARP